MPMIPSFVGHVIGKYRIEQLLAQGQASVAFRMRHAVSSQTATFTIALVPETLSQQAFAAFMTRFATHAARLTALSHEHLLPVLDYGEYCGYPYLMTAGGEGTSVATVLKHLGRYSPESALNVLRQVASVLDYVHLHGIVHGNLRPATLFLQQDQQLRLSGPGMIQLLEARGIVQHTRPYPHLLNLMGTYLSDPVYLAPEYVQGKPLDASCDLYALGLLLFELLSGKPPFSGRTYLDIALQRIQGPSLSFSSCCPELKLSPQFDLLLSRALAYAPEQRFGSAAEMVSAYERILEQPVEVSLNLLSSKAAASEPQYPDDALSALATQSAELQSVRDLRLSETFANDAGASQQKLAGSISRATNSLPVELSGILFDQPDVGVTTEQHALIVFPRQDTHAESDRAQTMHQPERQAERKSQLIPQAAEKGRTSAMTSLPVRPSQSERNIALLRQIEEYVWNEQELPTLSPTEPMLITPLGPLFPSRSRQPLSWRGRLYLVLLILILALSCIGLGAWGMEQFQHHSAQPAQPQQQRPAQSDNVIFL